MKSCSVDCSCTPGPKDALKLLVFLCLFCLSFYISSKMRFAELIFRPSRFVVCENQENDTRKQWSHHIPPVNRHRWPCAVYSRNPLSDLFSSLFFHFLPQGSQRQPANHTTTLYLQESHQNAYSVSFDLQTSGKYITVVMKIRNRRIQNLKWIWKTLKVQDVKKKEDDVQSGRWRRVWAWKKDSNTSSTKLEWSV